MASITLKRSEQNRCRSNILRTKPRLMLLQKAEALSFGEPDAVQSALIGTD